MTRRSSSNSPAMPSMSFPRWTCASKISVFSGSSRRSSSSHSATSSWARCSASSIDSQSRDYHSPAVPDVLIYADTIRSPEMRHEVPISVPDPFLYVERDGSRHSVSTAFEVGRIAAIPGGPRAHPYEEFGYDELIGSGLPREDVDLAVAVAACKGLGVEEAVTPLTFPMGLGERLWQAGIRVTSDNDTFAGRGGVKSETEIAGTRPAPGPPAAGKNTA